MRKWNHLPVHAFPTKTLNFESLLSQWQMEKERGKNGKLSQLKLKILNTCEVWEGKRNWKLKIRICWPWLCCGYSRWKAFSLHFVLTFPFSAFVLADKSFKSCDCGRQHIPWCCLYRWNQGPLKDPRKEKETAFEARCIKHGVSTFSRRVF